MKELTVKQRKIFEYLERYALEKGYPPTIREVGEAFQITAKGAYDHLKAIEKKRYIKCIRNRSRAIEILKSSDGTAMRSSKNSTLSIPLLGRVAAGMPLVAEENIEEYLSFPRSMVKGDKLFALRVTGDSMKDAGIYNSDIAIIRKQDHAQERDIVVALMEDEATLKYFYRDAKKGIRLEPANKAYKAIYTRDLAILGKLVGIYRPIE